MEVVHRRPPERGGCLVPLGEANEAERVSAGLHFDRKERLALFQQELAEREQLDVLDRALLKAHHSKINGVLPAPEYHRLAAKIDSLKKLRFTESYEKLQDPETYEWMKYKVAAEVGGTEEKAAFALYEKLKIQE